MIPVSMTHNSLPTCTPPPEGSPSIVSPSNGHSSHSFTSPRAQWKDKVSRSSMTSHHAKKCKMMCASLKESLPTPQITPIENLDVLVQRLISILYIRNDPLRLEKCEAAMESYVGEDWIFHSTIPETSGYTLNGYSRSEVWHQPDLFNLLVLSWSPNTSSAIHNHPCDRCLLMPLQGGLSEIRYDVDESISKTTEISRWDMNRNKVYWIDDSLGWHKIESIQSGLSVSLHLYVPAFSRCKMMDRVNKHIRWTDCSSSRVTAISLYHRVLDLAKNHFNSQYGDNNAKRTIDCCQINESTIKNHLKLLDALSFTPLGTPTNDDSILSTLSEICSSVNVTDTSTFSAQQFFLPDPLGVAAECLMSCLNMDMPCTSTAASLHRMEWSFLRHLASKLGWAPLEEGTCTELAVSTETTGNLQQTFDSALNKMATSPLLISSVKETACNEAMNGNSPKITTLQNIDRFDGCIISDECTATMLAVSVARSFKFPNILKEGLYTFHSSQPLVAFTSLYSHTFIKKSMGLLGLGTQNLIYVAVKEDHTMDSQALRKAIQGQLAMGRIPFFVNCTAGTSLYGAFDPFEEIKVICEDYNLWMHVDGSLGGNFVLPAEAPFSTLTAGIGKADSIFWTLHKALGIPPHISALLTRYPKVLENVIKNEDIAEENNFLDGDGYPHFCKEATHALKAWCLWKKWGDEGMSNHVRLCYTHVQDFANMIKTFPRCYDTTLIFDKHGNSLSPVLKHEEFPLTSQPIDIHAKAFKFVWKSVSFTCCFWWIPYDLRNKVEKEGIQSCKYELNRVAATMQETMQKNGFCKLVHSFRCGNLPAAWCLSFGDMNLSRINIFGILCYLNSIGLNKFPAGYFKIKNNILAKISQLT